MMMKMKIPLTTLTTGYPMKTTRTKMKPMESRALLALKKHASKSTE